jgi:hypothetical protein
MTKIDGWNRDEAIRELIAVRAYELWENQGRPEGCDLIHWHEAEQEILSSLEQPAEVRAGHQTPSQAATAA